METQNCRKKSPRFDEFSFLTNCNRQKRFSQNERRRADLQNLASNFQFLYQELNMIFQVDGLHDTRAPFWTGIGTGSRARQVHDPNDGSRVSFRFWPQRRRLYTCILFLSCALPRSRSRQNSRARQRTGHDPLRPVNLKLEVAWPRTWNACAADTCWWIYR